MKRVKTAKTEKKIYPLRTRFAKDIVCEFLPPSTPGGWNGGSATSKALVLCGGAPGYPGGKTELMNFLAQKGFWVFIPRYRGTWESGGSFLARSPHLDVLDVVAGFSSPRGFRDAWSGKTFRIVRPRSMEAYVIGSSFGGAAAILASRDPRIRRAVALSPVTDWRAETKAEPLSRLAVFTRDAFGEAYRNASAPAVRAWKKLRSGTFYNPMHEAASIDGSKLLIIHPKDDTVVYGKTSAAFARATGARLILLPRGGHLGTSSIAIPEIWRRIGKFLDSPAHGKFGIQK